ncbi:MAG: hypothetical protein R3F62_32170, partial [Planctomycetota bacterium]
MNACRALLLVLSLLGAAGAVQAQGTAPAVELDPFADVRRSDGTLRWGELMAREGEPGPRLRNFSLESFARELAHVIQSGDRARTEEFFDGVIATDFYRTYGVFAVSSTAVELGYDMAYRRYLHRYLKPRFVSGVLRSNLALATGIALAELANGTFNGKAFAISMGSLGLSSALVEAAATRIPALHRFKTAIRAPQAGRLLRAGGFVYQTAELAVVFFVGRLVEEAYYGIQARRDALEALQTAGAAAYDACAGAATPEAARDALVAYEAAWTTYRNVLYGPLLHDQAVFLGRLERLAEDAKLVDDRVQAALRRAAGHPELPLVRFAQRQADEAAARFDRELDQLASTYLDDTQEHFAEVYTGRRAATDPFAVPLQLVRTGAPQARAAFVRAHAKATKNRLQSYAHERTALLALAALAPAQGAEFAASRARVDR